MAPPPYIPPFLLQFEQFREGFLLAVTQSRKNGGPASLVGLFQGVGILSL